MFLIITKAQRKHTFLFFWHRSRAKYFLTQLSSCQLPKIVSREAELITDDCSGYSNGQSFIVLVLWASYPNLFIFRRLPACQVTFPHMNQSLRKVASLPLKLLTQNRANFTNSCRLLRCHQQQISHKTRQLTQPCLQKKKILQSPGLTD